VLVDLPPTLFGVFGPRLRPAGLQRPPGYADPDGVNGLDGLGPVGSRPGAADSERIDSSEAGEAGTTARSVGRESSLSPAFLAYVVGPIALVALVVLVHFDLVAGQPWIYALVILGSALLGKLAERWTDAPPGSLRLHARVALHASAVTSVIYMSGWGPAVGMAYAFSAFADLQQAGARAWRALLGWSLAGCAIGQVLVLVGWAPSYLNPSQAQTIGGLGAFVFAIAIRMVGAILEFKERAEGQLAEQTRQAAAARDDAQRSEAHYRAVVENAAEGILTVSPDGKIGSFNGAAEAMFGWTAGEIVGKPVATIVTPDLHSALEQFLGRYRQIGEAAAQRREVETTGVRRDGSLFPMVVSTSSINVDGAPPTISGIIRDLSDQKRFEAQLSHQVLHDPLTGLPNRVMLTDRLEQALARVRRRERMFALLFVDLDRFKSVNDTLGHTVGDQLLVEAASRIESAVRETDTVARLGGDEFVVLCEDIEGVHQAADFAERIITALQKPFVFGTDESRVSASIGMALSADGDESAEEILSNADIAMYRAKGNGRSRYELFDEAMQLWVTTQVALEAALREAVPRNELRLFCQPFIAADTGMVRGFEALLRWERPGFGLVSPDAFIPMAEEAGLMLDIGAWVLEEACRHAAEWWRRWPERRLGIAVNLSQRQLLTGDILQLVSGALERSGLPPSMLTLEVTENALIDDTVGVDVILRELRTLGVNLSLDDFGTGYSSLTFLHTFPINIVKIDRSFVEALGTEHEDLAVMAALIAFAQNLDLRVVAEGIENHDQLAKLLALGCPYLQGYLFSQPRPIEDVDGLVGSAPLGASLSETAGASD
jgi:diguanylate cyclase (GGDEF)-like protein/PAS domain S-box-containing protein